MKLLLDMNLPQSWLPALAAAGHEAVHWRSVGSPRAKDSEIMGYAMANRFVVLTHDLDFGQILAATGDATPSVVQIRSAELRPQRVLATVLTKLDEFSEALANGALLTIDLERARLRVLPLPRPAR